MVKVKYEGSANSVPRYGITMADGAILDIDEETAKRIVAEGIGFSYVSEEKKKKGEK